MLLGMKREIKKAVEDAVLGLWSDEEKKLKHRISRLREVSQLEALIRVLKEQVSNLDLDQKAKEADWAEREREVKHKVGLEQTRQKQELELAKREAKLEAGEGNLSQERKMFEERMKFQTERLDDMKELLEQIMLRLPSANIDIKHRTKRVEKEEA